MDVREHLIQLINEQNDLQREVTLTNVVLGLPRTIAYDSLPGLDIRNTAVSLLGIENLGYRGHTDVYYARADLGRLLNNLDANVRGKTFTPQVFLEAVNKKYNLSLTLVDLEDFNVPVFTSGVLEERKPVTLVVRDANWEWAGSITIDALYGNPVLDGIVRVHLLPILKHPDSLERLKGRLSGTLATYHYDFTPWVQELNVDPLTGTWSNFARVQELGRQAGLSFWHNGYVIDAPTSEVPTANQAFERVLIQQYARGDVLGPLYFHYDQNW